LKAELDADVGEAEDAQSDDSGSGNESELQAKDEEVDLEDLGNVVEKYVEKYTTTDEQEEKNLAKIDNKERRPMLTDALRKNLSKEGYKLIGSHSGVKLCRWTKAMMRGRGGCYKHTFYGISSFQCMEMTPSLACANKCTFCWRSHTNPVGKEFSWQVDTPEMILEQALSKHAQLIKTLKGVPGVLPERLEEAKRIRHCALSLVGEPIIVPR